MDISSTICCALARRDFWYSWYPVGSGIARTDSGVVALDSAGVLGTGVDSGAGPGPTGTAWNFLCLYLAWRMRFRRHLCSSLAKSLAGLVSMGFADFRGFLGAGSMSSVGAGFEA